MPTVIFITKTKTVSDTFALDLTVRHRLQAGEPSANTRIMKTSPPQGIDVVLGSSFTVTISGMFNGTRPPLEHLGSSRIAQHLVQYLRMNSTELGIDNISELYISEDTENLTLSCSTSRVCRHMDNGLPHLTLLGFDLEYIWSDKTSSNSQDSSGLLDASVNPFSRQLALPYMTAIDNVVDRFITFQVVKRYPLIFASWCRQLDTEQEFLASLFTSMRSISKRSESTQYLKAYNKQLKAIKRNMTSTLASAQLALSDYLSVEIEHEPIRLNDETAFKLAMEHVFRAGMKRKRFKCITMKHPTVDDKDDDDLLNEKSCLPGASIFAEEMHSCESDNDGDLVSSQPSLSMDYSSLSDGISELGLSDDETPLDIPSDSENEILSGRISPLNVVGSDEDSHDIGYFGVCWDNGKMSSVSWDCTSHISPTPSQILDSDICLRIASPRFATEPGLDLSIKNTCESSRDVDLGDDITPHDLRSLEDFANFDLFNEGNVACSTDVAPVAWSSSSSPSPRSLFQRLENTYQYDPSSDDDLLYNACSDTPAETCGNFNSLDDFSGMIFDNEDDGDGQLPIASTYDKSASGLASGKEGAFADGVISERYSPSVFQNVDFSRLMTLVPSVCKADGFPSFNSLPLPALDAVQDLEFSAMDFEG